MTRPTVSIFDVTTQEETVREMNDAEFAQYEIDKIRFEEKQAEQEEKQAVLDAQAAAKAVAKAEILAALNLSQETLDILKALD